MSEEAPVSIALACAARGWHVFPCNAKKQPLTKNGFKDATTDPEKIRYFWEKKPQASIGIATGASGLVVVDLDVKGADNGCDAWAEIVKDAGTELEDTALVDTPSGGMHVYYRANGHKVGSNAGKLAAGIDVRAEGGYVIAAGSPGYLYVDGHGPEKMKTLPAVLGERLAYRQESTPLIPPESLTIPEGRRDSTLASLGGTMRRRGMDEASILAALLAENKAHCRPPLPATEVERIARSVARYEPKEAPVDSAPADPASMFLDWSTFWDEEEHHDWIFENVLARGRGHAIYAMHKGGKSLLCLYMAAHLATHGHEAAYFDYEMTAADVRERLADMGYGPADDLSHLHYALLPSLPALDCEEGGKALAEIVDLIMAAHPDRHLAVFIDTISRAVLGEENSADTWRLFYMHTGLRLKQRGVTWTRLDHGGKDSTKGQRGSSSKGDDVDVVWKLVPMEGGVELRRELARMSWVPEKVALRMDDFPLAYVPAEQGYREGTAALANLMDRLGLPLNATKRAAGGAIRAAGEHCSSDLIMPALKWRREKAVEIISGHFKSGPDHATDQGFQGTLGPDEDTARTKCVSSLRTTQRTTSDQESAVSTDQGTSLKEVHGSTRASGPLDIGDMP